MYFINPMKCIDTDYLEKSCSDAITVTRQADYSLVYFGLGTPYPEPRSQFELSVHVSFSPFHGVFSYWRSGGGGSNKIHCSSESRSNGKGLVSNISCVERVRFNNLLGKVTELSYGHSKEENWGMVCMPIRWF